MTDLPFAAGRTALLDALRTRGTAVVQAPPGTGKTTLAPQYVLEHVAETSPGRVSGRVSGRVIVTQPRRVAARGSAARIATLRGSVLGNEVGYTVRGDRKVTTDTVIEMVTPGVLLRRLLADPDLDGVAAVVIDEIHERHLESDLVFAMLAQVRELRDDLIVVAMSATVEASHFAALLGGVDGTAPLVDVPSPIHPLDIRYADSASSMTNRDRRSRRAVADMVETTVRRALDETAATGGDVLAFVPTIRDTESVAAALSSRGITASALHGRLSAAEQSRIVGGHDDGRRRVVVATDVAESSLTVPGVRVVVDSCLARVSRRDTTRDMSVLVTETASQASCTQRAGRAGREGPGTVYRCITAEQFVKAPAYAPPAVTTSDLTSALLDVACWGSPRGADLPLPDPFPTTAAEAAERTLRSIGAVDDQGFATETGRQLAAIPTDPRIARGGHEACRRVDVRTVAAVLSVLDDGARVPDLTAAVRAVRPQDPVARRFQRLLSPTATVTPDLSGDDAVAYTLACAFPGLIARRVDDSSRYLTASGTGVVWRDGRAPSSEWIVVADLGRTPGGATDAQVHTAVPVSPDLAFAAAAPLLTDEVTCTWLPGGVAGKLQARRVRCLGAIELSSTPVPAKDVSGDDRVAAVRSGLQVHGLDALEWSAHARDLRRRIQYLHNHGVPGYPDVRHSDGEFVDFVVPDLTAGRRPDLAGLLRGLIPWDQPVDELAPESLTLPGGRTVRITYPESDAAPDTPAVVATKLQDCFGLRHSPEIAGRRIQFHLLSPARRPVAITDDLGGFWDGAYRGVRRDLRGRYPKHSWPENP
ncbi:ATP-dependent RNA helicase [Corynebacterium glyciniphilum]|uniref:ATP-dependent RNA helicase n=1 Tax=Corynebacterium glyciniphilum TaxID=1404244 RepID=UPI00057033DA|nr:ATP-dependent helicase C-terminal domain-containing protein [Corynebacterium glyciniphilum]